MKAFLKLAKSGIVTLVVISVLGGFLMGVPMEKPLQLGLLLRTLLGVLFLAAGSSAWNQIQDLDMDRLMPRTAKRPLASGDMSLKTAWTFVAITLGLGAGLLSSISWAALTLGLAAVVSYNGLYTLWWKRKWAFAAIPGAVPGALPILIGYVGAHSSGEVAGLSGPTQFSHLLDPAGIFLFAVLFFWQMPHFWVLAIKFRDDYKAGGVPTLSVARGTEVTVQQILLWCLGYSALSLLGPLFLDVKVIYAAMVIVISAILLWQLYRFVKEPLSKRWLHFFLWVNFSLIFYLAAAVIDRWMMIWMVPFVV